MIKGTVTLKYGPGRAVCGAFCPSSESTTLHVPRVTTFPPYVSSKNNSVLLARNTMEYFGSAGSFQSAMILPAVVPFKCAGTVGGGATAGEEDAEEDAAVRIADPGASAEGAGSAAGSLFESVNAA